MQSVPSLENFKSREEWEARVWKMISKKLAASQSAHDVEKMLSMLLTAYEKKQVIKRASTISLLKEGKSYQEIGSLLWISPETISAIQKSAREQGGYTSRYSRTKKNKKRYVPPTKKEIDRLILTASIQAFFTFPPPLIPHPRLPKIMGGGSIFPKRRKHR